MSEWPKAVQSTVSDWRYCFCSRTVWVVDISITLVICAAPKMAPPLPAAVLSLIGHGAAFALASVVLAERDIRTLAFARPLKLDQVVLRLGAVVLPAVVIFLVFTLLTLGEDWRWLPWFANGPLQVWLYIGLGVIPSNLVQRHAKLEIAEWARGSAIGALPVIVLAVFDYVLRRAFWEATTLSILHNLLSIGMAVCSGAIYYGIQRRMK